MAAAMIVLGLISCVGFYFVAQPSQDAVDENIEQLMRHMRDMDQDVGDGWKGVKRGQRKMKKSMKFLEHHMENMSDYSPNYKGSMAATAKVTGDTLTASLDSTEDLKPENV
jgi:archaellum component FlaC